MYPRGVCPVNEEYYRDGYCDLIFEEDGEVCFYDVKVRARSRVRARVRARGRGRARVRVRRGLLLRRQG